MTCIDLLPRSNFSQYHQAIVCGQNLSDNKTLLLWQSSGLIHLLVVSASHLQFFHGLKLRKSRWPWLDRAVQILIFASILVFALMTSMQPPILRSLMSGGIHWLSSRYVLLWTPQTLIIVSGLATLGLSPQLHHSVSLQLSWVAVATLAWSQSHKPDSRFFHLQTHATMWIFMLPLLATFSIAQPTTVLMNAVLGPLVAICMFPLGFMSLFAREVLFVADPIWSAITQVLAWHQQDFPMLMDVFESQNLYFGWSYVFLIQMFFLWSETKRKDGRKYLTPRLRRG